MTPTIVSRAQAGLENPRGTLTPWRAGMPTGDTEHYEGSGGHTDHGLCIAEWRSIQRYHLNHPTEHYADIAYNFGVCQHGVVFEGRGFDHQSAAQRDGNDERRAICYMGGPLTPFTDAAKLAFKWLHTQHAPHPPNDVRGHRDEPSCSTSCPGDRIEQWIRAGMPTTGTPTPGPTPAPPTPPLPPTGIRHPMLRRGNVGPAVLELQRKLNGGANTHLALDGDFGPRTEDAVRNFQAFFKLGVDGIVGPKTWAMVDYCAALKHVH